MGERGEILNPLSELASEGTSAGMLATVLARVARAAPEETSRPEIAIGRPESPRWIERRTIPQGTVSKAVTRLTDSGLLALGTSHKQQRHWIQGLKLGSGFVTAAAHVEQKGGSPARVTTGLCDIGGAQVLAERSDLVNGIGDAAWENVARTVHRHVDDLLNQLKSRRRVLRPQLLGLGIEVGAPVIDGTVTPIVDITTDEPRPVDLAGMLGERFHAAGAGNVAIVIENDVASLAVLAINELHYARSDLAVAAVFDDGVGGGLIMDGRLRRGRSGKAMEIGHLVVGHPPGWRVFSDPTRSPGPVAPRWKERGEPLRCPCGQLGHVDAFATPNSLRRALRKKPPEPPRTIFAQGGAALGRALSHVCNVVDPGELIVFVPDDLMHPAASSPVAEYMRTVEHEISETFAVRGRPRTTVRFRALPQRPVEIARLCMRAVAMCVLEAIIEQAAEIDDNLRPVKSARPHDR